MIDREYPGNNGVSDENRRDVQNESSLYSFTTLKGKDEISSSSCTATSRVDRVA